MKLSYTSIALAGLLCSGIAAAQAPAQAVDTIVITATRNAKTLLDVPVRTEVIGRAQLEQEHARDAREALRYTAGALLKPIHGKTGFEVWLQGMDGNRVLVLVDGERVTASTGSSVDLTQIGVADIKQIEIVKGAASALHGSSAMGGVINIITERPAKGWRTRLRSDIGSYGSADRKGARQPAAIYLRAGTSYSDDRWQWSLSADQRDSAGFLISGDNPNADINGADGYKRNLGTRLKYQLSPALNLQAGYRHYGEDHTIHNAEILPGIGGLPRFEEAQSDHFSAGLDYQHNDRQKLGLKLYQEDFSNTTRSRLTRDIETRTQGVDLQYDWLFANDSMITAGLAYNGETLEQLNNGASELDRADPARHSREWFVQYDYWLNDQWELLLGARWQDDSNFGEHTAPKLSLMYRHSNYHGEGRMRISYGNGYRVPNMKERYFIFDHSVFGYQVLGNAALQPEESDSLQWGYEWQGVGRWSADINLFYNDIDDLIETVFTGFDNGLRIFRYANIARARTHGSELGAQWRIRDHLSLRGAYTWLQAENRTPGAFSGNDLIKRPEHVVKLSLDWHTLEGRGHWLLRYIYEGKEFIDEGNTLISPQRHIWDIKYNHALSEKLGLYAGVDNIGNVHREPGAAADLRPVPGRFIYTGLRYQF
ncbi:MAG: hypothetical protein CSA54_01500 [Gammaproteobacteria bacterium]|nr:MAG: hypothetical protein CSA54_01500 [Gammaproteobacteria bacterium]